MSRRNDYLSPEALADELAEEWKAQMMAHYSAQAAPETRPNNNDRTPVRSEPIIRTGGSSRIVGVFALLFGIPLWLEAARFTRDGWILFINWICARFQIGGTEPWHIGALDWRVGLGLIALLGFAYSYVEMWKQPIKLPTKCETVRGFNAWRVAASDLKAWRIEKRWEAWIVWAVLIASDVATTYAGAQKPDPSGLAIMRDIAAGGGVLIGYAILLTFIPDRLARFGIKSLFGG
jgi:hypothetical protein